VKILFVDQFGALGGAQRCLLDLLPAVAERGWAACAAIPLGGGLEEGFRAAGAAVEGIECGPYRSMRKSVGDFLRFAGELPRLAKRIGAIVDARGSELLYVNGPRLLPAAAVAARRRGLPVVFHCHVHLFQRAAVAAAGWAVRLARARVIACCRFAAAPLAGFVEAGRLHVVYNGVADMARERVGGGERMRVGVIGRIEEDKGQRDFVEAARTFPEARFVVIGAPMFTGAAYFERVRAAAAGLAVEFPGWREDVAGALAGLDVLAVPSFERDPNPRVILEAFSAGVPVVAYPSGGIAEVIEDGVTGYLTRGRGAAALAARLGEALRDEAERKEVARRARVAWEGRFRVERYREEVAGLLESGV
jgi:glycosyltransferase involved in cell wall biosynthesis